MGKSNHLSHKLSKTVWGALGLTIFLIGYGSFTSYQAHRGVIHFDSNSKDMFWNGLFKMKKSKGFYTQAEHHKPDYFLARCGIYVFRYREYNDNSIESCMINKIRKVEKDKDLYNTYIEEAKEKEMSVFRLIRNRAQEECNIDSSQ